VHERGLRERAVSDPVLPRSCSVGCSALVPTSALLASTWTRELTIQSTTPNSHDMERFASVLAVDADFVNVRGWWWRGREEIQKNHATLHCTSFKESTMDLELSGSRRLLGGCCASREVANDWPGASGVDLTAEPRNGSWSWVALDRDGSLQIASSHKQGHAA
jgi:uncharacterized protein (TIGR02246 family)